MPILVSIELEKVDRSRFYVHKTKGKILDVVLIETPNGKYSDYLVKQSQTKEERDKGIKLDIIGNGKTLKSGNRPQQQRDKQPSQQQGGDDEW